MYKNKRGWIKIVEVSIVVLLIVSTLLIVLNQRPVNSEEENFQIYLEINFMLKKIQINQTLRKEILEAPSLPIKWDYFDTLYNLGGVKETVIRITPPYLNCKAQLTEVDGEYEPEENLKQDFYVQSIIIAANYEKYSPRKLILSCYKI